jgi:hypothetical protein
MPTDARKPRRRRVTNLSWSKMREDAESGKSHECGGAGSPMPWILCGGALLPILLSLADQMRQSTRPLWSDPHEAVIDCFVLWVCAPIFQLRLVGTCGPRATIRPDASCTSLVTCLFRRRLPGAPLLLVWRHKGGRSKLYYQSLHSTSSGGVVGSMFECFACLF